MSKFVLCTIVLCIFCFSLSGIEIAGSVPDNENRSLVLGKWETIQDGKPFVLFFTDRPAGDEKAGLYMFYMMKPGEQLNSRMDNSVYSLRKDKNNNTLIVLDLKQTGVPDKRVIRQVEFSKMKLIFRDMESLGVQILERQKYPSGGENDKQ